MRDKSMDWSLILFLAFAAEAMLLTFIFSEHRAEWTALIIPAALLLIKPLSFLIRLLKNPCLHKNSAFVSERKEYLEYWNHAVYRKRHCLDCGKDFEVYEGQE